MPAASYLVQEEDGTSRFELEEGGGFILLSIGGTGAVVVGDDEPMASVSGGTVAGTVVTGGDRAGAEVA